MTETVKAAIVLTIKSSTVVTVLKEATHTETANHAHTAMMLRLKNARGRTAVKAIGLTAATDTVQSRIDHTETRAAMKSAVTDRQQVDGKQTTGNRADAAEQTAILPHATIRITTLLSLHL